MVAIGSICLRVAAFTEELHIGLKENNSFSTQKHGVKVLLIFVAALPIYLDD